MNQQSVVRKIARMCESRTQKSVAEGLGISPQYLCDILKLRRAPGKRVYEALGLQRNVAYFPTNGS